MITLSIVVIFALGIGAFKLYSQMKNLPVNSMKKIQDTVANRDAENFYKLVDVEKVLDAAAQEILTARINSELGATAYSMQEIANVYEQRKPEFISAAKSAVDDYLASGSVKFPDNLSPTQKWLKDSDIDSCVVKEISKPVVKDNTATSKVEFYNKSLLFSFELNFALEKIDKNTWRIVGAEGFDNYLAGLNRALQKKLERLNAPVRDKIREVFIMKGYDAKVVEGDEYGFSRTMKIAIKADLKPEKPLSKIVGKIIIVGRDGAEGVTPFEIDMYQKPTGLQTFNVDKILNPFVRQDSDVMKHGLRKSDLHIEITEVVYTDGSSLKQFSDLPPE